MPPTLPVKENSSDSSYCRTDMPALVGAVNRSAAAASDVSDPAGQRCDCVAGYFLTI